tara:strand:+ start:2035 stop:2718 length:684 start_codon:yes stop_codon:yes gene_type:complete
MVLYSHNDINLKKKDDHYILSYKKDTYKHFWNNTISQLEPFNIQTNKDIVNISFKAYNIEKLSSMLKKNALTYRHAMLLFLCVGDQLTYLEKDKHSILTYNIDDFIVIHSDNEKYDSIILMLNTDHFFPIQENFIDIKDTFDKNNIFLSPELKKIKSLPASVSIKSSYYSLALLIGYCLNVNILNNINEKKIDDFNNDLLLINDTKLYFALLRCLCKDPKDRFFLFI